MVSDSRLCRSFASGVFRLAFSAVMVDGKCYDHGAADIQALMMRKSRISSSRSTVQWSTETRTSATIRSRRKSRRLPLPSRKGSINPSRLAEDRGSSNL